MIFLLFSQADLVRTVRSRLQRIKTAQLGLAQGMLYTQLVRLDRPTAVPETHRRTLQL